MINPISSINLSPGLSIEGLGRVADSQGADAFRGLLAESIGRLNAGNVSATAGEASTMQTLAGLEQTDAALGVMMQIQDRLVGAYQEIQNIRV